MFALFNFGHCKEFGKRKLKDCVQIIDWGIQLEDWAEPDTGTNARSIGRNPNNGSQDPSENLTSMLPKL